MDHLDKMIPLAILASVAGFLVVLLFRAARLERREAVPTVVAPPVTPTTAPAVIETPVEQTVTSPEPPQRKRVTPPPTKAPLQWTPIAKVLDMLKDKDALATAFLLREILDRPVSRR